MVKKEFIGKIAEKTGVDKKTVESVINAYHEGVVEVMKNDDTLTFIGFGTYSSKVRAERESFRPGTTEKMVIPAKKVGKLKLSKSIEL